VDKGVASARLALALTEVTPRVVFLTELDVSDCRKIWRPR